MNIGKYTGAKMDAPDAKLRKYRFPGDTSEKGFSPAAVLAQAHCDGRKAGDVDPVLGGFGDQRERVVTLAHAGQGPQQR